MLDFTSFSQSALYNSAQFFVIVFSELVLLFVLISMLVSWLQLKIPKARVQALLSGKSGYMLAAGLGAITPFCSCSTLPMMVGLLRAKAAFGPVMTFLFTSPLLNPFLIAMLWVIFGFKLLLIYSVAVLAVAIGSGVILQTLNFQRYVTLPQPANSCCGAAQDSMSPPPGWSFKGLAQHAIKETRSFLPHIALGVAVGAVIHGYVPASLLAGLASSNPWWLIPAAALSGILLYVRASTMLPLAATLVAKGVSLGTVMALTIGGAGASLPEMIILKRIFQWPLMLAFVLVVLGTAILTGCSIQLSLG
ncbi:permease [Arsukibacterium ikkense]|uniref:Permease n=1 Tax=Arsukibacterium ikkense TaxID=336831 RepID=A0A0M2V8D1_9GAMM|nr:permease [Arsukibacterium ikkense]KKO45428.1 permease [Arsukibacterium ikkense]